MGLKRKASFEDSMSSPSYRPATSTSHDSSPIHQQPDSSKTSPMNTTWNIGGAPYFNSRTFKRFRDNRPSEESIHQRTLCKLYSAQKSQRQALLPLGLDSSDEQPDSLGHHHSSPTEEEEEEVSHGLDARVELAPERNQRRLDAFFTTSTSRPMTTSTSTSTTEQTRHASPVQQTLHMPTSLSVLTYEDSSIMEEPAKVSETGVDAEMLDVDSSSPDVFVEQEEALHGDCRIPQEYAVLPGRRCYETYGQELVQKQWVGGIGWS